MSKSNFNSGHLLLISILIIVGAVLRFYDIGYQSFWLDESFSLNIVQAINVHGYPKIGSEAQFWHLDSGTLLWQRGPVYHYALSIITQIFEFNAFTVRAFSAFLGVLCILLFTYITKQWFGIKTSLVTAFFISVNYWQIAWSRQVREYILLCLLFWLTLYLTERAIKYWSESKKYFFWAIISFLTCLGVHPFGMLILIAALILVVITRLGIDQKSGAIKFKCYVDLFFLGIIFLCLIVAMLRMFFESGPVYPGHYIYFIWREYWPFLIFVPFAFVFKNTRGKEILTWLGLILFSGFWIISFSVIMLNYRYMFFLMPVILILAADGVVKLFENFKKSTLFFLPVIFTVAVYANKITLAPQSEYLLESDLKTSPFQYKAFTPQPNFNHAYAYINRLRNVVLVTPYPTISRLYRDKDDIFAIKVDLTGFYKRTNLEKSERYTGVNYLTPSKLNQLIQREKNVYVLLDEFSIMRMDVLLKELIFKHGEIVRKWSQPQWSKLVLIQLNNRTNSRN